MTGTAAAAGLQVRPLVVPESVEGEDAADLRDLARISNAMCRHDAGHDHFDADPEQMLPEWRDQTDTTMIGYVARLGGETVGVLRIQIQNEPGTTALNFDVMVDPERWGEGVEDALLDLVDDAARNRGLTAAQTWTLHRPDAAGGRLHPPTGFGSIPADDRQTRLMLAHGYSLEQVERNSAFDLRGSMADIERMLADAERHAGEDYRTVSWTSPTPPEYKDGFAFVLSRMSTDTPDAGMEYTEEVWDADRVDRYDERSRDGAHTVSVAAVQHVPSGRIVAYNELVIGGQRSRATQQYGTLVVREHRGHRLGTIVKCANLLRWRELVPESPVVTTFNAEENRPMLDINEAIGFVPVSYAGAWKKVIAA